MRLRNALCLFALGCSLAGAAQLDFTWSGYQETIHASAAGSGSFAFPDGLTTVTLPELTAFQFSGDTLYYPGTPYAYQYAYTYSLANLMDFGLTFANGAVATLTLDTTKTPYIYDNYSIVDLYGGIYGNIGVDIFGPVTITSYESVPEPVSFALLGLGMVAIGGWQKLAALIYPKAKP